jgi:hypothetical protein
MRRAMTVPDETIVLPLATAVVALNFVQASSPESGTQ